MLLLDSATLYFFWNHLLSTSFGPTYVTQRPSMRHLRMNSHSGHWPYRQAQCSCKDTVKHVSGPSRSYHTIPHNYHVMSYRTMKRPRQTIPYQIKPIPDHTKPIPYHAIPYQTHTRPCHIIPYHTIPYHTIPYHTIPCHAMPCHAMPCHAMPCHAMPCHAMPCHIIQYQTHTVPCHIIPYHAMPYHTISYHTFFSPCVDSTPPNARLRVQPFRASGRLAFHVSWTAWTMIVGGPFLGCPDSKSPLCLGSVYT